MKPWAERQIAAAKTRPGKFQSGRTGDELIEPPQSERPGKYRNQPCVVDGKKFDSKLEARVFLRLVAKKDRQSIVCQVSIPIGKQRIRPDFMVIHERLADGRLVVEFVDAKGRATPEWNAKANHLFDAYGIPIRLEMK